MSDRQQRWLEALLIIGTIVVAIVLIGFLGSIFFYFGDVILVFFLAWLLAFILSPIVSFLVHNVPALPRVAAVVLVYSMLLGGIIVLAVVVANTLAQSISDLIANLPSLKDQLPSLLAPWQRRLDDIGLSQIDLAAQASSFLSNVDKYASQLIGPLQQLAVASLGILGNLLIIVILSLYMVIDRDRIMSFLFRLVPPAYADQAQLLETSVAASFGGFLRGQALMGVLYGLISGITSMVFGLPFPPVTATASGILQAIPFFGPFVSWLPPVLVAILFLPQATLPTLLVMGVGWFVVMNIVQPRLMEQAVGIHPIVVLGSVLVGSKVAGITGAIFGIPIAAVISAFFFHYFGRASDQGAVATRAARRLADRQGRAVRVPRAPGPVVEPAPSEAPVEVVPRARPIVADRPVADRPLADRALADRADGDRPLAEPESRPVPTSRPRD